MALAPSSCELSVRSISGHSGQGVEGARKPGGRGMISNWRIDAAFWRWQVPRQSAPVSPPPMMTTCLPAALIQRSSRTKSAGIAAVVLGQEIHGKEDAVQLTARNVEIARPLRAAARRMAWKSLLK